MIKAEYWAKRLLAVMVILTLAGCTNVAGGAFVYAVSSQSPKQEKKNRKYTAASSCLFEKDTDPYITGQKISYGAPLTGQYEKLLYVAEGKEVGDPVPPHHLAFAFYTIADRIGDKRAAERKDWLAPYMIEKKPEEIEALITKKYMDSYLSKCFVVPQEHLEHRSTRKQF